MNIIFNNSNRLQENLEKLELARILFNRVKDGATTECKDESEVGLQELCRTLAPPEVYFKLD